MTDHEPFVKAISAQPDDPAPRMIYADWLEERGDPRAEFIRLHVRLAEQPENEEFFGLIDREQTIRPHIDPKWLAALGCEDAYARLYRLDEGLWLENAQVMVKWGMTVEQFATLPRWDEIELLNFDPGPAPVRQFRIDNELIWRGMPANAFFDFTSDGEQSELRFEQLHLQVFGSLSCLTKDRSKKWKRRLIRRFGPLSKRQDRSPLSHLVWQGSLIEFDLWESRDGRVMALWIHPRATPPVAKNGPTQLQT